VSARDWRFDMRPETQVALVTGAASGLGRLSCERLGQAGAKVAALDVNADSLAHWVNGGGDHVRSYVCDVTDEARVREVAAEVERELGPIDRVIHAAAIMPGSSLLEHGAEVAKRVMRVNYDGTVNVVQATLPRMLERGRGVFLCFGSVAGHALTPGLGAYCASKAAVNAYLEVLIHETAGRGVLIHLACPPMVDTPLIQQALTAGGPKSMPVAVQRKLLASPTRVLDAIDAAIESGQHISFPMPMAKWLYAMRRVSPALLWRVIERSEAAS
jgi:NAD(P)-dependent dehydrogenase (short-subunit alcohol dehydrogenase family)